MANICLYKIIVKGKKLGCEAFVRAMPSYGMDYEFFEESGTDEDYTIGFMGDCKWSVHAYTSSIGNVSLLTDEELKNEEIIDSHYYTPMDEKSILFGIEIFCNYKDIDDSCWSTYEHYKNGKMIFDECPKVLHIKRGRDYDRHYDINYFVDDANTSAKFHPNDSTCKVRFSDGKSYWYIGEYDVGDLVYVEGKKEGLLGIVKEISIFSVHHATYNIVGHIGNINLFTEEEFDKCWTSFKPKERKEYLKSIGFDETMTKKQYFTRLENEWILVHKHPDDSSYVEFTWEDFCEVYTKK